MPLRGTRPTVCSLRGHKLKKNEECVPGAQLRCDMYVWPKQQLPPSISALVALLLAAAAAFETGRLPAARQLLGGPRTRRSAQSSAGISRATGA